MLIKSIISIKWKVLKKSKISLKSIIWIRLRQVLVKCWSSAGQVLVNCLSSAGHVLSMAGHIYNVDQLDNIDKFKSINKIQNNDKIDYMDQSLSSVGQMLVECWSSAGQVLVMCWSTSGHIGNVYKIDNIDTSESIDKI